MILSFYRSKSHSFQNPKKTGFPGFFSQLPETRIFKFFPELETLVAAFVLDDETIDRLLNICPKIVWPSSRLKELARTTKSHFMVDATCNSTHILYTWK